MVKKLTKVTKKPSKPSTKRKKIAPVPTACSSDCEYKKINAGSVFATCKLFGCLLMSRNGEYQKVRRCLAYETKLLNGENNPGCTRTTGKEKNVK